MTKHLAIIILAVLPFSAAFSAQTSGQLSFRTDSFLSTDYSATADKNYGFIGAQYSNLKGTDSWKEPNVLLGEVSGLFSPQAPSMSYLNVSQVYIGSQGFQFGRKIEAYSLLDERWQKGMVQPLLKWNPLTPDQQGLTGFFFQYGDQPEVKVEFPLRATLFASFLYIPDQNANFQIKNGVFEAVNPWFPKMPSQIQFDSAGKVIDKIDWVINKPHANDIVFNSSYLASVSAGQVRKGFYAMGTFAYKPSNQLAMGGEGYIQTNNTMKVTVLPKIFMHSIVSGDVQYSFDNFSFGLGFMREKPNDPDFAKDLTYVSYSESMMLSPVITFFVPKYEVSISYIDVSGGDTFAKGPIADKIGQILPKRFDYRSAYRMDMKADLYAQKIQRIIGKMRVINGADEDYTLLETGLDYRASREWTTSISQIMIRSGSAKSAPLFQEYASNDSLSLGVSYVF